MSRAKKPQHGSYTRAAEQGRLTLAAMQRVSGALLLARSSRRPVTVQQRPSSGPSSPSRPLLRWGPVKINGPTMHEVGGLLFSTPADARVVLVQRKGALPFAVIEWHGQVTSIHPTLGQLRPESVSLSLRAMLLRECFHEGSR